MCHLVTWRQVARSNADLAIIQSEEFVDEDEKPGLTAAMERAEELVGKGEREVRVWKLAGVPELKHHIEWKKIDAIEGKRV